LLQRRTAPAVSAEGCGSRRRRPWRAGRCPRAASRRSRPCASPPPPRPSPRPTSAPTNDAAERRGEEREGGSAPQASGGEGKRESGEERTRMRGERAHSPHDKALSTAAEGQQETQSGAGPLPDVAVWHRMGGCVRCVCVCGVCVGEVRVECDSQPGAGPLPDGTVAHRPPAWRRRRRRRLVRRLSESTP
jgi:hypothetical protein